LDAILSLVLNLEEKLTVMSQVHTFLAKYLKSDDWNCRKICVDIGNALLIINNQISESIHGMIKELKYDKIKHVRESVNNYEVLYKQNYGEETPKKHIKQYTSFRENKINAEEKRSSRSPAPVSYKAAVEAAKEKDNSLERSFKIKEKNESFFKNAKNSNVIKVTDQANSCLIDS
jgi:hypothetical protein